MVRWLVVAQLCASLAAAAVLWPPWHQVATGSSFPCLLPDCRASPNVGPLVSCRGVDHLSWLEVALVLIGLMAGAMHAALSARRTVGWTDALGQFIGALAAFGATFWASVSAALAHLFVKVQEGVSGNVFLGLGLSVSLAALGHAVALAVRLWRRRGSTTVA